MKPLLTGSLLNQMRTALYGSAASLTFYTISPSAGETVSAEISSGWYAQRNNRTAADSSGTMMIWLTKAANDGNIVETLHTGGRVTINANGRTQSFRIREIKPMAQIGTGWLLNCDPAETSTEPDNG